MRRQAIVAVVGRPNVGKSSFFNWLVGSRLAIVDDMPGVTRDRLYARSEWQGRPFTLIDTGGIEPESEELIPREMRRQAEMAIDMADAILFICDIKTGLHPEDQEIAMMLRRSGKPILVLVNKCDDPGEPPAEFYDFYQLGIPDVFSISAAHRLGLGEVLDCLITKLPELEEAEAEEGLRVAIIGRPNAGKSSLLNRLAGEERAIVSDIAGTTRDSIDSELHYGGRTYVFVDTAGLRRKSRIDSAVEHYSIIRAIAAIERADVCLILIDAEKGVTEQDTKVAGLAHHAGKACIFVVNKWDLIEKETGTLEHYREELLGRFRFMDYAPVLFISARTGQRCKELYPLIDEVYAEAHKRVPTGQLNDFIAEVQQRVPAPQYKGRRLKIAYATQVAVAPPEFILFVNSRELLHFSYDRYLENQFRRSFGFKGNPIRLTLREKGAKEDLAALHKKRSARRSRPEEGGGGSAED